VSQPSTEILNCLVCKERTRHEVAVVATSDKEVIASICLVCGTYNGPDYYPPEPIIDDDAEVEKREESQKALYERWELGHFDGEDSFAHRNSGGGA
jgi:hypothetical protein